MEMSLLSWFLGAKIPHSVWSTCKKYWYFSVHTSVSISRLAWSVFSHVVSLLTLHTLKFSVTPRGRTSWLCTLSPWISYLFHLSSTITAWQMHETDVYGTAKYQCMWEAARSDRPGKQTHLASCCRDLCIVVTPFERSYVRVRCASRALRCSSVCNWTRSMLNTRALEHTFQRVLPCSRTHCNHVCKQLWSV